MSAAAAAPAKRKRPSICHSCQAPVIWVLLTGKIQPVETCDAGVGDVAIELELPGFAGKDGPGLPHAVFVSGQRTNTRRHIDSCPHADKWRERWKRNAPRPFSKVERKKTK
jgi:hypothetical protein